MSMFFTLITIVLTFSYKIAVTDLSNSLYIYIIFWKDNELLSKFVLQSYMLTLNKTGVYNITEQKSHVFLYNKDPNVILC